MRTTAIVKTFAEVFNVSQIAVGGWTTCYCFQPSEIN